MKKILLKRRLLLSVSAIMGAAAMQAQVTDYNWTGAVSTDFYNTANWTSSGDPVEFVDPPLKEVRTFDVANDPIIDQAWPWQPLIFDAVDGNLTVNADFNCFFNDKLNGTVTINTGAIFTCRNIIRVGREGNGVVDVNGTLRSNSGPENWQAIFVGVLSGGNGTINVNDGGLISGGYQLEVGTRDFYPMGTVNLNEGGISDTYWLTSIGPNGVFNVNGGTLNCGERLIVGDTYLDNAGNAGTINGLTGLMNVNSGTVTVNHLDLVREDGTYLIIHEDGKIVVSGGTLRIMRTGSDMSAAVNTFIANEQIVTVAGKELVVNYDGTYTTVTAQDIAGTDSHLKNSFALYPNPTNGQITVQPADDFGGSLEVAVVNMLGKTVMQAQLDSTNTLDVSALASGIYMMNISNGTTVTTQKFIKE